MQQLFSRIYRLLRFFNCQVYLFCVPSSFIYSQNKVAIEYDGKLGLNTPLFFAQYNITSSFKTYMRNCTLFWATSKKKKKNAFHTYNASQLKFPSTSVFTLIHLQPKKSAGLRFSHKGLALL